MRPERVWINGVESAGVVPVTDSSVLRGDGCFEVLRVYSGKVFALDRHIDRLEQSAEKLVLPLPERSDLELWIGWAAADHPEGAIRVLVTRGSALPGAVQEVRTIVFSHNWQRPAGPLTLLPVKAPWHASGEPWELAGAKVLSYAPNMAASRSAQSQGFEDALLVSSSGSLLEGPTFAVAWVHDGVIETPTLDLGILDSVTRGAAIDLARSAGRSVVEDRWGIDRLLSAQEVFAMSTIREIQPVVRVGDVVYESGPVTEELGRLFSQLVGSPSERH